MVRVCGVCVCVCVCATHHHHHHHVLPRQRWCRKRARLPGPQSSCSSREAETINIGLVLFSPCCSTLMISPLIPQLPEQRFGVLLS